MQTLLISIPVILLILGFGITVFIESLPNNKD